MPSLNTTATLRKFSYGTIELGTGNPILHIVDGSIEIMNTFRTQIPISDQGVALAPLKGPRVGGMIRFRVKLGSLSGSTSFFSLAQAESAATTNAKQTHQLLVSIPTDVGATAGERITIADAVLTEAPTIQSQGADQPDECSFAFSFTTTATIATY